MPLLYSIAAFIACFICIQAEKVTYIFGGEQFKSAAIPVMIMALYPIHQTYGQLNSTIFLATGQTRLYSIISIIFVLIGLPLVFFLIAPTDKMGYNAGATGLAIKMVSIQFIAVNVQLFFHSRFLKLKFIKYFAHQLISTGFLIIAAIASKTLISLLPVLDNHVIGNILASGSIYCIIVFTALWFFPIIFGLHNEDIRNTIIMIKDRIIK